MQKSDFIRAFIILMVLIAIPSFYHWTREEIDYSDETESYSKIEKQHAVHFEQIVFDAVDKKAEGFWDEEIEILSFNDDHTAAIGVWFSWDAWYWLAWRDDSGEWKVAVDTDGFDCSELDAIPQRYNSYFREIIYGDTMTRRCF